MIKHYDIGRTSKSREIRSLEFNGLRRPNNLKLGGPDMGNGPTRPKIPLFFDVSWQRLPSLTKTGSAQKPRLFRGCSVLFFARVPAPDLVAFIFHPSMLEVSRCLFVPQSECRDPDASRHATNIQSRLAVTKPPRPLTRVPGCHHSSAHHMQATVQSQRCASLNCRITVTLRSMPF